MLLFELLFLTLQSIEISLDEFDSNKTNNDHKNGNDFAHEDNVASNKRVMQIKEELTFNNFVYSISTNEITITGYQGTDTEIFIPEFIDNFPVVSIGEYAFNLKDQIVHITLPNSIREIEKYAFKDCSNLEDLILPNKIESIAQHFISGCPLIKTIIIPKSLQKIRSGGSNHYPFAGSSIEQVTFEEGTTKIIDYLFYGDVTTLKEVILPGSLTSIGNQAFSGCSSLNKIDIPNSVTTIGSYAFKLTSLKSVILPNKLQIISNSLFLNCKELTTVTIPNSVTTIDEYAFNGCIKLNNVDLPNEIKIINGYAFENCVSFTKFTLPNKIESIAQHFISGCSLIRTIIIPKSLQKIRSGGSNHYPFAGSSIEQVTFEEGTTKVIDYMFYGDVTSLKKVILPDSLTSIGRYSFHSCSSLTQINVPDNVESIGSYAFHGCSSLTTINIPNKLTIINTYTFRGCSLLAQASIPDSVTVLDDYCFEGCISLTRINIPINATKIGVYAFSKTSIITVTITNKIKQISYDAFANCKQLVSVFIPENVTSIGTEAFISCERLKTINIPPGITIIRGSTFRYCYKLNQLFLPQSIEIIETYAFAHSGISSINLPEKITKIDSYLFYNCTKLSEIIIPKNVVKIFDNSFRYCKSLKKVISGELITTIGSYAFDNCNSLTRVDLYSDVTSINKNSFSNCPNLVFRLVAGSYSEEYAKTNNIDYTFLFEVATINVKIINDSDISGMKIILKNVMTNAENTIIASNSNNIYTIKGLLMDDIYNLSLLNKYGVLLAEKTFFSLESTETTISLTPIKLYVVSLKVFDKDTNDVTNQTTIKWFDENAHYLSTGSFINQLVKDTKLFYEIILNDHLLNEYFNVQQKEYIVKENNDISVTLIPFHLINISGKILNETGDPINAVAVLANQQFNGKIPHNYLEMTNEKGEFTISVYSIPCKFVFSRHGYISKTIQYDDLIDNRDIGSVILTKISGRKILVDLKYFESVIENVTANKRQYHDLNNLKITVYNTVTKKNISEFVFQHPYIILPNYVNDEDIIQINISVESNEFSPISVKTEPNNPNISITVVQRGSLLITYDMSFNANNIALIYNKKGMLVDTFDFRMNNATTTPLENGTYTVVAMGKTEFFNAIQSLKKLRSNLKNKRDYVSQEVNVDNGIITNVRIGNIPIFDESLFYYTDNKKTTFYPNKRDGVLGSYFSLTGHVEFKKEYKSKVSNIKLLFEIPNNCLYLDGSLVVDRKIALLSYNDNTISTQINENTDTFRLCVVPSISGRFVVNAYIEFEIEGKIILQPIKSAEFEIAENDFYLPQITGKTKVISCGKSIPKSQIILYDNDVIVGSTTSSANGQWIIEFNLFEPSTFSSHSIYVKTILPSGIETKSNIASLIYSVNHIDVSQITLLLFGEKLVYDYPRPLNNNLYYVVHLYHSIITFLVNFTDNDPERIKNVVLRVQKSNGKIDKLKAKFDNETKVWMAQKSYFISALPVNIIVDYDCDSTYLLPPDTFDNLASVTEETIDLMEQNFRLCGIDISKNTNTFTNEGKEGELIHDISYVDEDGNISHGQNHFIVKSISQKEIDKIRNNTNYEQAFDQNNNEYFIRKVNKNNNDYVFIDVTNKTITTFSTDLAKIINNDIDSIQLLMSKKTHDKIESFLNTIEKMYEPVSLALSISLLNQIYGQLNFYKAYTKTKTALNKLALAKKCMSTFEFDTAFWLLHGYFFTYFGLFVTSFSLKIASFYDYKGYIIGKAIQIAAEVAYFEALKIMADSDCYKLKYYDPFFDYVLDPSGFVYEAVESNRIQGVTTTIFEQITNIDVYGDKHEIMEVWDSQKYGQQNPLITDEAGWYAWDVPKGFWQVKYEKTSYETTYSELMEVPPPRLDVNIPVVSFVEPEVSFVSGYTSRIEIEFSKYMNIKELNLNNIIVTKNDDIVSGTIEFSNKEMDPSNMNSIFASIINFIPFLEFQKEDNVHIFIKKDVISYSGVKMKSDFSQSISIIIEPKIVLDSESTNISFEETRELSFEVTINPIESSQNKKLFLELDSQNIIQLESNSIPINENGVAKILIKVQFPGTAIIKMTLEGTKIKSKKNINVLLSKEQLKPVIASIESYSTVYENTPVDLYSPFSESTIYYSINDTDNYHIYSGSILITQNMILSAISYHEDYKESEPALFYYSVVFRYYAIFDANGGSTEIFSKEIKQNEPFGELPIPYRDGYSFDGWFTDLKWQTLITQESIVDAPSNITLYAKWTYVPASFTIKIDESEIFVNETPDEKSPNGNKKGLIIGISVGCAVGVVAIVVVVILIVHLKRKKGVNNSIDELDNYP